MAGRVVGGHTTARPNDGGRWHFFRRHRKVALDEAIKLHFAMPPPHRCRGRSPSPRGIVPHASPAAMALRDSSERSKSLGYARRPSPRGTQTPRRPRPGRNLRRRGVDDKAWQMGTAAGAQNSEQSEHRPISYLGRRSPLSTSSVREDMWRRNAIDCPDSAWWHRRRMAGGRVRISCRMWLSRGDNDGE